MEAMVTKVSHGPQCPMHSYIVCPILCIIVCSQELLMGATISLQVKFRWTKEGGSSTSGHLCPRSPSLMLRSAQSSFHYQFHKSILLKVQTRPKWSHHISHISRVSSSLSRTFLELALLFQVKYGSLPTLHSGDLFQSRLGRYHFCHILLMSMSDSEQRKQT